ncbi:B12-binding domain-containing radical SAM protein [Methanopyrus sp.]
MKVLLVQPPYNDDIRKVLGATAFPVGLLYLSAYLEREGFSVDIVDCPAKGLDIEEVVKRASGYDAVGITVTTPAAPYAYEIARRVKEKGVFVFLGGPHPTFMDGEALRESHADAVVRGEGELTTADLLDHVDGWEDPDLSDVPGISYLDERGKLMRNDDRRPIEDLDSLPLPAYDKIDISLYAPDPDEPYAPVITSRGCPFQCAFCASSRLLGKEWRARSADHVVREIEYLVEEKGVERIEFVDDVFAITVSRVEEIGEKLRKEGIDVPWDCGTRANLMTPEMAKALQEYGCRYVYVGAESASDETLRKINKQITTGDVYACRKVAARYGLGVLFSFILGFPWEDRDDIKRTIRFAIDLKPDYAQFTVCTPYPGTPLYDLAEREGLIETKDWSKYTTLHPVMRTLYLSRKELKKLLRKAYVRFYLDDLRFLKIAEDAGFRIGKNVLRSTVSALFHYVRDWLL